jgi:CRISPR-associated protein Cst2
MIASSGENRRRTAPVRTSAAIGLFPFKGDRDLGTKSKEQTGGDVSAGGNIFETEIYYNYFKVNILIELDRFGKVSDIRAGGNKQKIRKLKEVSLNERRERFQSIY